MKAKRRRHGNRRDLTWAAVGLAGAVSVALAAAAALVRITEAGLPPVPSFDEYASSVPKVSRVLASDGSVVAEFFTERRTVMRPGDIPPVLEKAILAAEDADFFEHEGLSYWGILRAMAVNVWRGRISQGGSTITQQVVKQVLLSPRRTFERKFREMLLARLVELKLTKKEILAIYASEVYLGRGRYGFEEAARFYFGKSARDLGTAEAAMLAGLTSAPEANNPVSRPKRALARRRYVLRRMLEEGFIGKADYDAALNERLVLWGRDPEVMGRAPYFVDAVRREITRMLGRKSLEHEGLVVRTTLDLGVQDAVDKAVAHGLKDLWDAGRRRLRDEKWARASGAGVAGDSMDPPDGPAPPPVTVPARVVACDGYWLVVELGHGKALAPMPNLARMNPVARKELCRKGGPARVSDAGWKREGTPVVNIEIGPQVAIVVLDPLDHGILALAGGEDFDTRPFNRAVQSRRPMGSTVKPFLYASALEAGVKPSDTFTNARLSFSGRGGRRWYPRNYHGGYDGRKYTLAQALAQSINVIAVKVLARIGVDRLARMLRSLGILGHVPRDLSLALGSAEASPVELANAYAVFATGGMYDTPYFIDSITDHDGRLLFRHEPRPSRRVRSFAAKAIRRMLRLAVTEGTARRAASLPSPAWGKTGTTNRSREAWFVGSDGRYIVSVLVGYDDRLPMHGATGGNTAVGFFVDVARAMNGQ